MADNINTRKVSLDRRCVVFVVATIVVLSAVVGVVVWKITQSNCSRDSPAKIGEVPTTSVAQITTTSTTQETTKIGAAVSTDLWRNLRLPNYVVPVHYDITIYPDFYEDNGWFYGNETVELDIERETKIMLINANLLNITRTELRCDNGEEIQIQRTFWYEENQFWVIEVMHDIPVSKIFLELQFDGSLTRAIVGLYKSSYTNSITGQRRHLVSSKFQPVDARSAFPCFDEPSFKAEYSVTLVHKGDYWALSNMPNTETSTWEENSSLMATKFQRSPKMSTYLVCFVVCDFGALNDTTKHGTQIRVFAPPDRLSQAKYALRVMKITMDTYEDLFMVPFPLPKNDMIAIPDFASGAMEHWGLITYREGNLLYDPTQASAANKQRVAKVVAHEIAHMWFGNLVTMDWWNDLWLNEGFASFVQYLGVNEVEPDWQMLDQMVVKSILPVMESDSGLHSHPIVVPVQNPDEISQVFDSISYNKGAAIIRMLQETLGSDAFFSGISRYLRKYEWATASTDDLWAELGMLSGNYTVKEVMDTWTLQMGLPFINITLSEVNGQLVRALATQHRFLADRATTYDADDSPFGYKWYIHIDYAGNMGGATHKEWITRDDEFKALDLPVDLYDESSLVKFNVNQTGYYRVNYPDFLWRRFAQHLHQRGPSAVPCAADRSGLLSDAFNLARGGYLGYDVAMEMTRYLVQETDNLPWESAYRGISDIKNMFSKSGKFDALRKYFGKKLQPIMEAISWDDSGTHLERLMRANIIRLACDFGDSNCLSNATARFRGWLDHGETVSPDVRTYVYKYGMLTAGTEADWDVIWNIYLRETVPQERSKLIYGLANTHHVWLLNRYLEYVKDPLKVRTQDVLNVVTYIAESPVGNGLAWDWVRSNWDYLVGRFSYGFPRRLGRLIPSIVSDYNTGFKLQQVEAFFKKYPDAGGGSRGRQQALESIRRNIAWMDNNSDQIEAWLKQQL